VLSIPTSASVSLKITFGGFSGWLGCKGTGLVNGPRRNSGVGNRTKDPARRIATRS
jgi:hypothetical protein